MVTHTFPGCTVIVGDDWALTVFEDGTTVSARSVYDEPSRELAAALGYGTGDRAVDSMTREHDLLHTLLALRAGNKRSGTLWGVAHDEDLDHDWVRAEEARVLDAQAALNGTVR